MTTPRELVPVCDSPDTSLLDITWNGATGMVVMRVEGKAVLTMSPEAAAWMADQARVCALAADAAIPTAAPRRKWLDEIKRWGRSA